MATVRGSGTAARYRYAPRDLVRTGGGDVGDNAGETAEQVLFTREGAVATLTINRPERRNALSTAVIAGLRAGLAEIAEDRSLRAVVLTGAGDKAFCAGA